MCFSHHRAVVVHACAASWDGRAPKTGGWSLGVGEKNQGFLLFFNHEQFGFPADFPINSGTWIGLLKGLDLNLLAHLKWASTPAWFATLSTRQLYLSGRSKLSFLSPASFRHGCFQPSETTPDKAARDAMLPCNTRECGTSVDKNGLTIMV